MSDPEPAGPWLLVDADFDVDDSEDDEPDDEAEADPECVLCGGQGGWGGQDVGWTVCPDCFPEDGG